MVGNATEASKDKYAVPLFLFFFDDVLGITSQSSANSLSECPTGCTETQTHL